MMTKKYKLITTGAISAATLGLLAMTGSTFAHSGTTTANGMDGRPQLTAEQKVANVAAMKVRLTDALTKAVTEGKITTDQPTHILDIMDQIHTKLEVDDHVGADLLRVELKAYLTQQNIDASVVPGLSKEGHDGKDKNQHVNNGHHYGNDKGDQHKTMK